MATTEDDLLVLIRRTEGQLLQARTAAAEIERLLPDPEAYRREIGMLEGRLQALQEQRAVVDAGADRAAPDVEDLVMRAAGLTGTITTTAVRALAPLIAVHQIQRAIDRLVAAGRLVETDDTDRPTLGRGRSPRVYSVAGAASDTGRGAPVDESARIRKSKVRAT